MAHYSPHPADRLVAGRKPVGHNPHSEAHQAAGHIPPQGHTATEPRALARSCKVKPDVKIGRTPSSAREPLLAAMLPRAEYKGSGVSTVRVPKGLTWDIQR